MLLWINQLQIYLLEFQWYDQLLVQCQKRWLTQQTVSNQNCRICPVPNHKGQRQKYSQCQLENIKKAALFSLLTFSMQ